MVKIKEKGSLVCASIFPTLFLIVSYVERSPQWIIGTVISLFVIIAVFPMFRKMENLWMFLFVAVFGFPINIFLAKLITPIIFVNDSKIILVIYSALVFFVLFSVEEIVFGLITKILWRRQYKLFPREFDEYEE